MAALSNTKLRELKASPVGDTGNRVGRAIELTGLTQLAVAAATKLPQPYVSDVARGRYQTITVDNAHKFADFFGCAIEDLFPSRNTVAA